MRKIAIIDTTPRNVRHHDSINLGLEIITQICKEEGYYVEIFRFWEKINISEYHIIAFNVFYLMNQFNIIPFFNNNNIPPKKIQRDRSAYPLIIGGGAGFVNQKIMENVFDYIVFGEGENAMRAFLQDRIPVQAEILNNHIKKIESKPIINLKTKRAMIELTRGCKYRCNFCVYGWTMGKYREKEMVLIKEQILEVKAQRIKVINFLSCNFGGFRHIQELVQFCYDQRIRIANADFRIDDYLRLKDVQISTHQNDIFGKEISINLLSLFKTVKVGLESPDQACRFNANKRFTDDQFSEFFDIALKYTNYIHFYLIYGLPKDNEEKWLELVRNSKDRIRKITHKKVRIEFSITNFEPSPYTPFHNAKLVDFTKKDQFLAKYIQTLTDVGFINPRGEKNYGNMRGKIGRSPETYAVYMWFLKADSSAGDILINSRFKGISRSMNKNKYQYLLKQGVLTHEK